MTRATADALWGCAAVRKALAEPEPAPVDGALAAEVSARADPPGALRAWALGLPWRRFCAVVRLVAGTVRRDTPPSKLDRLRSLMADGAWDAALALAARFPRLGAHEVAIRRGHEAAARPDFQRQLGRDPAALRAAGIAALRERYEVGTGEEATVSLTTAYEAARRQISLRVDPDVWERLGALARRTPLDRAALAREAMRIGAEAIESDPGRALDRERRAREAAP